MAAALALVLISPAAALAVAKPAATTGGVAKLTPTTVSLLGKVNPSGAATTYAFQYGPTTLYGATTPAVAAGGGTATINVVADVTGLAPATKYHYRLVAMNRLGTTSGADRTFTTKPEPLGLTLAATPNPVAFGKPTVLAGTLSGTGNAGRQVVLQSNPFPYTQGFASTTNVQLTSATGTFSFPLLSVPINTQYRVLIPTKTEIASPIVSVGVAPKVATSVTATRVRRGQRVRFSGTIRPGQGGERIAIQKLKGTRWVTVAGTSTHRLSSTSSRYSKRIRISSGGSYRVFVAMLDGRYVANNGRTVRIRLR
ncbi:MAG: hypothetical protein H0W96_15535 [Solirubrobacterales bacterium]|nr:hypothetical protein [Solirubrobacterales bacterium]